MTMNKIEVQASRVRPVSDTWLDDELAGCTFKDERLGKRLRHLLKHMGDSIGGSIPLACQDWANVKAAYRFFSNDRISEEEILAGHFQATSRRAAAVDDPVLILQDTTEFTYKRSNPEQIGAIGPTPVGRDLHGRLQYRTVCGLLMHSSLAVTTEGLPLGLCAIKFWTRKKFKGTNALKKKVNPTRVPIEQKESIRWLENMRHSTELLGSPGKCIHIGDRESDIFELFCLAQELGTHFLVRSCVDRLAGEGKHTIAHEMDEVQIQGAHDVEVRDGKGKADIATVEIKYRRICVLPPIGKHKRYPALKLTVIHARERDEPENRPRIDWKLITDLPVQSREEAIEKLQWYAMRWKIEEFHKILKSGCKAEEARLRTAERLVRLIAVFCILGWRVFWMTMANRSMPDAKPALALTEIETKILDRLIDDKHSKPPGENTLSYYLTKIARLGGYLARRSDPPPGNMVIWRGISRLTDIKAGATMEFDTYG